ncbi:MAG: Bax inhibitor-1/YccA family protein [Candidatus Zambryskibacteria bacterium]|nr:Bax inhibitor-1/YccA family protein [Candidatus Zambryskibacteria bacterium]
MVIDTWKIKDKKPVQIQNNQKLEENKRFMYRVYSWMFLGLIVSGFTAYVVASEPTLYKFVVSKLGFYSIMTIGILIIVILKIFLNRINANLVGFLFLLYCFTVGLLTSMIFLIFTIESIGKVFFLSASMFGIASAYGYMTNRDLTAAGNILRMGFLGIVISFLINIILGSPVADYAISIAAVAVFTGFTSYYTQRIKSHNIIGNEGTPEDQKEAVFGALLLYLAFLNMFVNLLKIFGKRRS